MDTENSTETDTAVKLRNPYIAGLLAWLVPGLGHWYQGRTTKAVLFAACIIPLFLIGAFLGSDRELGPVRNVYLSWDLTGYDIPKWMPRPFFIPQAGIGSVAVIAWIQSKHVDSGAPPLLNGLMAPPAEANRIQAGGQPTLNTIIAKLQFWFELGLLYTVVAGLLNILAVFDAMDGPLRGPPSKKE